MRAEQSLLTYYEVKFRTWNKPVKRMYYWPNLQEMLAHPNMIYHDRRNFEPEYIEWMQYTGLKDKNGKEIYEGDIVVYGFYKSPRKIVFGNCGWRAVRPRNGCDILKHIEIIGNIYENPEL